jgi:hypothetical protein
LIERSLNGVDFLAVWEAGFNAFFMGGVFLSIAGEDLRRGFGDAQKCERGSGDAVEGHVVGAFLVADLVKA